MIHTDAGVQATTMLQGRIKRGRAGEAEECYFPTPATRPAAAAAETAPGMPDLHLSPPSEDLNVNTHHQTDAAGIGSLFVLQSHL